MIHGEQIFFKSETLPTFTEDRISGLINLYYIRSEWYLEKNC
jgi:hypothetical protein